MNKTHTKIIKMGKDASNTYEEEIDTVVKRPTVMFTKLYKS